MSHRAKRHSAPGDAFLPAEAGSSHSSAEPAAEQFPSEHKRGLLPERFFRWRGGEITRLEAFCDVVFGFALTLLVVSLEVPRTYAEMMTAMRGFLPFAVCFAQLVMIWVAHYRFSRRFGLEDPYTVLLNIILLFLVLFFGLSVYLGNGRTIGKRMMGIRVISIVHHRMGLWHSIERALGYGASALEFGFGFVQYFIHPNRRTVHDRMAETIVIRDKPS